MQCGEQTPDNVLMFVMRRASHQQFSVDDLVADPFILWKSLDIPSGPAYFCSSH